MLPLWLDVRGRFSLVVGGGPIGRAKARTLAEAGATVTLLALEPPPDPPPDHGWHVAAYSADFLGGQDLVVAAAPPDVNARVTADARARKIWAVSCSNPGEGDAAFPATWSDPPLTVAVSTGGASPALARELLDLVAAAIPESYRAWLRELQRFRPLIKERVPDRVRRRELLRELGSFTWAGVLEEFGLDEVRRRVEARIDHPGDLTPNPLP